MEQSTNVNESQKVNRSWFYIAIVAVIILFLSLIGGNFQQISYKWLLYALIAYLVYLSIKRWEQRTREPSLQKHISIVKSIMLKEGVYLDDTITNVFSEHIGKDLFALQFISEGINFLIHKNKVVGKSIKSISDLQYDYDRSELRKLLAEKGIVEVVE